MISALQAKLRKCRLELTEEKTLLKKKEDAYDSLRRFKSLADRSHEGFDTANNNKKSLLNNLNTVESACLCAQEYRDASSQLFNRIGDYVVGKAFYGLEAAISVRVVLYRLEINNCIAKIERLRQQIEFLEQQIVAAQALAAVEGE